MVRHAKTVDAAMQVKFISSYKLSWGTVMEDELGWGHFTCALGDGQHYAHISLTAVRSMSSMCSSLWTGLGPKLAHESRKGLTMETSDLMSLAGSLPFQSAALLKNSTTTHCFFKVSYYYYYYYVDLIKMWQHKIFGLQSLMLNEQM